MYIMFILGNIVVFTVVSNYWGSSEPTESKRNFIVHLYRFRGSYCSLKDQ